MVEEEPSTESWRLLELSYNSVYENLALEEALAQSTTVPGFQPTARFWVDPPSVIVGRFQRISDEVDTELCVHHGIEIGRRFTGGGAVFHDEGNLNVTIVSHRAGMVSPSKLYLDMSRFILDAVSELGLEATFLSPNSVLVGGKKVSGSAAAMGAKFQLWHSSTLVSSDLDLLADVLAPSKRTHTTAFVRSHWHPVTSLSTALGREISLDRVKTQLMQSIQRVFCVKFNKTGLTMEEEASRMRLHELKYASRDWNMYGLYKEY